MMLYVNCRNINIKRKRSAVRGSACARPGTMPGRLVPILTLSQEAGLPLPRRGRAQRAADAHTAFGGEARVWTRL